MSESRAPYNASNALYDDFPEALKLPLQLVQKNAASDESIILLQCLATAVDLPREHLNALRTFSDYCLEPGLSDELKNRMFRVIDAMRHSITDGS